MAETRIDKRERRKLTPTWVGEPQPLYEGSNVKVLRFNADNGLQYETFKQSLFPIIKMGEELDADTELHISKGKDGTEYPHWRVSQVYQDGKPVVEARAEGRPQYRGRDEDRVDQRTFVMEVGQDIRSGIVSVLPSFIKAREIILTSWMKPSPKEVKSETKAPEVTQKTKSPSAVVANEVVDSKATVPSTQSILDAKSLMEWAYSHGKQYGNTWVRQQANIKPNAIITEEMAIEAYKAIKALMGWS